MSYISDYVKKYRKLTLEAFLADRKAAKEPDIFNYSGIHIYSGWQGSGKTASMVYHLRKLKDRYPKAILSSNLALKWLTPRRFSLEAEEIDFLSQAAPAASERAQNNRIRQRLSDILTDFDPSTEYLLFTDADELAAIMHEVHNGLFGHIIAVDEIHLYFNSTKSRDTSIEVFAAISQLRKNRTIVLGTSQIFMRLEKAVREQATTMINCRTSFGFFTRNTVYDAHTLEVDRNGVIKNDPLSSGYFLHTTELRDSYDTYQIVQPSQQLYEQNLQLSMEQKKRGLLRRR